MSGKQGFTLIEILIVVVILGILAGVVFASVGNSVTQTKEVSLATSIRQLRSQITAYSVQHNDTAPDGTMLADALMGQQNSLGPYVQNWPPNPANGLRDVKVVASGTPMTPDGTTGWVYRVDGTAFTIIANIMGVDSTGKAYAAY